ncbi:hypothetical protein QQF64_011101, partial [Cirrhinus molitorella]
MFFGLPRPTTGYIRYLQTSAVQTVTQRAHDLAVPRVAVFLGALGIAMSGYSSRQLAVHHRPSTRILNWMSKPAINLDSPGSPEDLRLSVVNQAVGNMGNNSGKERHGSSGTPADTYETPPASPYSLVSTCSPTTQLVSISNCTITAIPETAQDALSSISQNDEPLSDCKTGPEEEAEERLKMTDLPGQVSHPSDVPINGDTEVDAKLLQECLNTLQLNNIEESTHILNDLLKCFLLEREKMKEELRSCKEKIQAEREEWQQFQADLKVALVVSDRLRAEAEEELSTLRAARQDLGTQLANALQGRQEVESQLESLRAELEQSKQKLKQVTSSHQGASTMRGLERQAENYGKITGPENQLWTDEMKGNREMCISGTTERSRSLCRLPSDYPDVVVNGTSQPSVTMTTESTSQSKTQAVSLDQQNNKPSSSRDKKVENLLLQTCNSSVLDMTNKINRTRTQEDFPSGFRSLRLHGSSRRNSLLRWCQVRTQGYKNIEITNFSSCWVDGLAFCAIYHSYLPSHIPYDKLSPENKKENLTLAFQTGEGFGICASLTVEEMLKDEAPDWHRVLEYVESIYRHFEMFPITLTDPHSSARLSTCVRRSCNAVREGDVPESLRRIEKFLNTQIEFHELDLLDKPGLEKIFKKHSFYAVMHFAGLKAVGESVEQPLRYYRVNLTGTINLLEVMQSHGVHNLVFSSSATVYGDPQKLPIDEQHPVGGCTNPYGKTKYFIEEMIRDQCTAEKDWNAVLLRYFNPIGAHISGQIGEDPQGIPNNLLPYVAQVAIGRRKHLNVFGNDYNTPDGTGVRDYIHVVDLAKGHIAAVRKLKDNCGCKVYNLGTGTGYSVLQMVNAMEKASGRKIAYEIAPRRSGDVASCYADPTLAEKELSWKAEFGLERMCEDLWRWQSQNPTGF